MHSDGNSFCGDVVLDSSNKASRDEDNINSKYARNIISMILVLKTLNEMHTYTTVALNLIL